MSDLISREAAIKAFEPEHNCDWYTPWIIEKLEELPSAEAIDARQCRECKYKAINNALEAMEQPEIVRCKDCKHRPSGTGVNHDIEFPDDDYKCPCQCEDFWYSWKPADDWYCANGERRTDG